MLPDAADGAKTEGGRGGIVQLCSAGSGVKLQFQFVKIGAELAPKFRRPVKLDRDLAQNCWLIGAALLETSARHDFEGRLALAGHCAGSPLDDRYADGPRDGFVVFIAQRQFNANRAVVVGKDALPFDPQRIVCAELDSPHDAVPDGLRVVGVALPLVAEGMNHCIVDADRKQVPAGRKPAKPMSMGRAQRILRAAKSLVDPNLALPEHALQEQFDVLDLAKRAECQFPADTRPARRICERGRDSRARSPRPSLHTPPHRSCRAA